MSELHASYGISRSVAITLSNSATIKPTRAILLDVAGAVKVTYADGAIDTALIFGTLKQPPANLPATFAAHWLEAGALVNADQLKEAA